MRGGVMDELEDKIKQLGNSTGNAIKDIELLKKIAAVEIANLNAERKKLKLKIFQIDWALELACRKLVDLESENKESIHTAQYWYDEFLKQAGVE